MGGRSGVAARGLVRGCRNSVIPVVQYSKWFYRGEHGGRGERRQGESRL